MAKLDPGTKVKVQSVLKELRGKVGFVVEYNDGYYWVDLGEDVVPFKPEELRRV